MTWRGITSKLYPSTVGLSQDDGCRDVCQVDETHSGILDARQISREVNHYIVRASTTSYFERQRTITRHPETVLSSKDLLFAASLLLPIPLPRPKRRVAEEAELAAGEALDDFFLGARYPLLVQVAHRNLSL